ncbi:NfeD family protein [Nodosilinea sp. P-1105]|uniref:NfeD family protein n=1 Tax=Nodosilinea sp. P-1105 TaxID=2546229 RepID=UPI00146D0B3B|nr:NfeD family protein [Nodosilinea sp. P-1105]NMF84893.1 NfeD family protein [Nodosilinea sp. P-1105]
MAIRWTSVFEAIFLGDTSPMDDNPLLRTSLDYALNASAIHHPYLNKRAVVVEPVLVGQSGRIYLENTWWTARCLTPVSLPVGTRVRVRGRDNLTLIVEPIISEG